jgi:cathepsin X
MGFFRIVMGKNALGIESEVAWATPGTFTVENVPCYEDGSNCSDEDGVTTMTYRDPSLELAAGGSANLRH